MPPRLVSIIIPAHNAAGTLAETLDSLLAQSAAGWEAIVVDDGSADETGAIAASYAERDGRIRLVCQAQAGEGGARNTGIAHASGSWLLFLDADDWITPSAIACFTAAITPGIDGVVAGWQRVMADGTRLNDSFRLDPEALFETTARFCPFAIHACLISRARVAEAGGFDPRLKVGADWDLWQRIARAGARFVTIPDVLALYRVRPQSAGVNVPKLVESGTRLIRLGHAPDPRVGSPDPRFANGVPAERLDSALLEFISWPAGILIGAGGNAVPLLDAVTGSRNPTLDAGAVAQSLFSAAQLPDSRPPAEWAVLWPSVERHVRSYLSALEQVSGAVGLARAAEAILARMVFDAAPPSAVIRIGPIARHIVDLSEPEADIRLEPSVTTVECVLHYDDSEVGRLELPATAGHVPHRLIAREAAERHGWAILERYFRRWVYPQVEIRVNGAAAEAWHGGSLLETDVALDAIQPQASLHDAIGWTLLLNELSGLLPTKDKKSAFDAIARWRARSSPAEAPVGVEICRPFRNVWTTEEQRVVELRLCGEAIGEFPVKAVNGRIGAAHLRALLHDCGLEIMKIAVREGIIGVDAADSRPLRMRLRDRYRQMASPLSALKPLLVRS